MNVGNQSTDSLDLRRNLLAGAQVETHGDLLSSPFLTHAGRIRRHQGQVNLEIRDLVFLAKLVGKKRASRVEPMHQSVSQQRLKLKLICQGRSTVWRSVFLKSSLNDCATPKTAKRDMCVPTLLLYFTSSDPHHDISIICLDAIVRSMLPRS